MLPILCTLEPKFLKIGVTFLVYSHKHLYLLSTTEFSLFEKSRNLPLLKKWVMTAVFSGVFGPNSKVAWNTRTPLKT